jgi:energy-converting hydrogenase Eha subunit A
MKNWKLLEIVLTGIALAMGIAVIVIPMVGPAAIPQSSIGTMPGIGLFCLALVEMDKIKP